MKRLFLVTTLCTACCGALQAEVTEYVKQTFTLLTQHPYPLAFALSAAVIAPHLSGSSVIHGMSNHPEISLAAGYFITSLLSIGYIIYRHPEYANTGKKMVELLNGKNSTSSSDNGSITTYIMQQHLKLEEFILRSDRFPKKVKADALRIFNDKIEPLKEKDQKQLNPTETAIRNILTNKRGSHVGVNKLEIRNFIATTVAQSEQPTIDPLQKRLLATYTYVYQTCYRNLDLKTTAAITIAAPVVLLASCITVPIMLLHSLFS
jgi:hypothetical protein